MEKQFTISSTPMVQRVKSAIWRWSYRAQMNATRKERVAKYRKGHERLANYTKTRECITL